MKKILIFLVVLALLVSGFRQVQDYYRGQCKAYDPYWDLHSLYPDVTCSLNGNVVTPLKDLPTNEPRIPLPHQVIL